MDAIKQCNFTPNLSARALTTGETKVLGVLVMYDISLFPTDFLTTILVGLTTKLTDEEYNVSLHFDRLNNQHDLVPDYFLAPNRIDGLFVISVDDKEGVKQRIKSINVPLVVINQQIDADVNCVDSDEYGGAYAVTSHLLEKGRRNIAFIGGNPLYNTSVLRQKGYEAALDKYKLPVVPELCRIGYYTSSGAYKAVKELLADNHPVDAIFTANDAMAMGAFSAIREAGLSIPEDIALVGFDDNEYASATFPPLTTVRKNREKMGVEAAKIMLRILDRKKNGVATKPVRKTLSTKLIVRQSSG